MISAMPAVALRRGRGKGHQQATSSNGKSLSQQHLNQQPTTQQGIVEYYHKKISRMSSFPPTRRTYSSSTSLPSPDLERQPLPGEPGYLRPDRCQCFGHVTVFHLGCVFLAGGLIMLFVSVGSVRGDVMPIRATGSSLVVLGALICLVRTIFFQRQENLNIIRRANDSFASSRLSRSPTSPLSPAADEPPLPAHALPTHDEEEDEDDDDVILCPAAADDKTTPNGDVVTPDGAVTSNNDDQSPGQKETDALLTPITSTSITV